MKKILALSALLIAGLTGTAQAATVDVLLGAPGSNSETVTTGLSVGVLTPLNLTSISQFAFATPGLSSFSAGTLTLGALNVGPFTEPGIALYNINPIAGKVPNPTEFSFQWVNPSAGQNIIVGTSDTNGGHLGSFTILGSQITAVGGTSGPINVVIIDPNADLTSAEFLSTFGTGFDTGFKVRSFAEGPSTVPLPGSLGLFMSALIGLFVLRNRMAVRK